MKDQRKGAAGPRRVSESGFFSPPPAENTLHRAHWL
ncbi:hypothetical protein KPNJ1_00162 [Klebsiella pneumoniae 30660/NJST258_1]|uniref:Uncharacterized protein n=1 Tax=Klebsiella pneumoniae 30684/NJST258_2 TaxID=1420013 RepID=W8VCU4_KLEPN|nr:hypothetical protein KPNJ2_00161 [Klebsiella pneumoniae 30684/NJST258_2]AHM82568.1 hypothetical protein KPNJ1_00162 [Klebsiella pneumoniae 30660/NJST258_1]